MASGHPDGGEGGTGNIVQNVGDIGEIPPRLFGLPGFYRSGKVIYADDMRYGLSPYTKITAGVSPVVAVDATKSYIGSQSIKCSNGGANANTVGIRKYCPINIAGKVGVYAAYDAPQRLDYFYLDLSPEVDGNQRRGVIRITDQADELSYRDPDNNYIPFGTFAHGYGVERDFYHVKLILNLDNLTYDKFLFNNAEYDLSGLPLDTAVTGKTNSLRADIYAKTLAVSGDYTNIDNLVITVDET